MTPEGQRIAIAEACGWVKFTEQLDDRTRGTRFGWLDPAGDKHDWTPDYLNDLNAMHEAVETLGYEDYQIFCLELGMSVNNKWRKKWIVPAERKAINATATQRAEAFLRTIGKFES